jgi:hypothetical protein
MLDYYSENNDFVTYFKTDISLNDRNISGKTYIKDF